MLRLLFVHLIFFSVWVGIAQEKTPFATYEFSEDQAYLDTLTILQNKGDLRENLFAIIKWSTRHKDFETVIASFNKLVDAGYGTADLHYKLAGTYGIRIDELSKIKALPYVNSMKINFIKAHQLDSFHLPTLEALTRIYAKLPRFLGGDFEKANKYAQLLFEISPAEGLLAKGFVLESEGNRDGAAKKYQRAFEKLTFLNPCDGQKNEAYFKNKSKNLSYQIASLGLEFNLDTSIAICALEYYLDNFDAYSNLPKEWVYYKLALLHKKQNNNEKVELNKSLALKINPKFKPALDLK
ncbi:MAG: hypothetical protein P8N57_02170 [Flavobacteriaceae bacterium]|nr:hypothetical protein [Flavobacteriaceae bacterium]